MGLKQLIAVRTSTLHWIPEEEKKEEKKERKLTGGE